MFGTRNRMRRHEMHALRQMGRHVAHDRALHRADIGDDRSRLEVWRNLLCDRPAIADRDAQDHEIRALHGLDVVFGDAVDDVEFTYALSGLL